MDIDADVIGTGPNVAFMPMAQAEKLIEENEHLRARIDQWQRTIKAQDVVIDTLITERDVLQKRVIKLELCIGLLTKVLMNKEGE